MVSIFGLSIQQIILIIVVILVISFIFFRRYFSALFYDYVVDAGLSFADILIGTLPLGDIIGSFIIFKKQKKIVGTALAIFLALEAANFLLGLVPIVGQPIEIVTNLIPSVFIVTLLFNKFRPAEKKEKKLEEEVSIAERLGIKVSHEKKILKKARKIGKKAPVDELKLLKSKKPIEKVASELRDRVDSLIAETNDIIQYIAKQNVNASQGLINMLQQGINQAGQLLQQAQDAEENGDFETAVNSAMQAKNIIISAANEFDQAYQAELQQNQMQGQFQEGAA